MNKVKITSGMNPRSTKIWLDDQPLRGVVSLTMNAGDVPSLTAEILLKETDIETTALTELFTVINGKRYKLVEQ